MFDKSFYPTPISTIIHMIHKVNLRDKNSILEPSAGKGDILDYIVENYRFKDKVYAVEKNPELQLILKGKGYKVLTDDFLTFDPANQFDLILMNPPFIDGVKHLLKAWEIIKNGEIVCLLNSETLNNPFSKERVLLLDIIKQHGDVEDMGDCFSTSEHKTNVNVSMVYLKKETKNSYSFDFKQDKEDPINIEFDTENPLAKMDVLENTVILYRETIEAYKDYIKARNKMKYYGLNVGNVGDALTAEFNSNGDKLNAFVDNFKESCWNRLFNMTDFSKVVTEKVYQEFQEFQKSQGMMDFTVNNIKSLFDTLLMSRGDIMEGCLVEVFDEFTRYHEDNRVYIEGWKTNKFWKVTKKVILPYTVERTWSGGFNIDYRRGRFLDDIDKAMCYISGKKWEDVQTYQKYNYGSPDVYTGTGIRASLLKYFQTLERTSGKDWNLVDSEFFTMRFFKKGTLHIVFKDEYIWSEFNLRATKSKNWLGNEK